MEEIAVNFERAAAAVSSFRMRSKEYFTSAEVTGEPS